MSSRRTMVSKAITQLNLHLAVAGGLLVLVLVLLTRTIVAWHDSRSDQSAQYDADLATYAQLRAQAGRLQALPAQLKTARTEAASFVASRVAASDSTVLAELGALTTRDHVRLSRAGYTYAPAIPGLVELRLEANVTGDYVPVMHFINDVERDKNHAFFIIRTITLTGQQGGSVNLRVRMTTYMLGDAAGAGLLDQTTQNAAEGAE